MATSAHLRMAHRRPWLLRLFLLVRVAGAFFIFMCVYYIKCSTNSSACPIFITAAVLNLNIRGFFGLRCGVESFGFLVNTFFKKQAFKLVKCVHRQTNVTLQ